MLESFDTKKLIIFGSIVVVLIVVIGFFIYAGLSKKPPEKITLQLWGTFDDGSYYKDAIDGFKTLYPNVTIVYRQVPFSEYESGLVDAFSTGTGPDIFMIHNTWLPKEYKRMQPLPETKTPLFTFKQFQETFTDVAVNDLTANQTIFAMPLYTDTLALYYNKDMFNTAGITTPPTTWEQLVSEIPALTRIDARGNITQSAIALGTSKNINRAPDILSLLMLQSGARMSDDSNTAATFADPVNGFKAGEQAMQFYTDFANPAKPDRYTWNDAQDYSIDAFANSKVAMMLNYSHHLNTLHDKSLRLNFGVAPMPQPAAATTRVDYANYWALAVAKQSQHPIEAWQFLIYLTSTDAAISYVNTSQRPPATRALIDKLRTNPEYGVFAPQALTARSWYEIDNTVIDTLFTKMIDDVNFNRATIKDALQSAQSQINVLMRKAQ